MKHTPWSLSKANVARDCNFRYDHQYRRKTRGHRIERSEGRIGSAFHIIVEWMLKGHTYEQAFRAGANKNKLTRNEMLELQTFKDPTTRFMGRLQAFRDKHGILPEDVLIEHDMAVTEELLPAPYWPRDELPEPWLRGSADVVLRVRRDGKKYLIIIDHKTGEIKPLETYENQLRIYGVMGLYHEPDIAGVQACIHWPRAEEDGDVFSWSEMWSADHVRANFVPWMREFIAEAEANAEDTPRATPGWYCDFCQYQHACPAKKVTED